MEQELELREVASGPSEASDAGERLREGVVADVASLVGAMGSLGALGYARAQYMLMRADGEHAGPEGEQRHLRRELELENRYLRAELYGLDALDAMDGEEYYSLAFENEPFDGFGAE